MMSAETLEYLDGLARLLRPIDLFLNSERISSIRCPVVVLHGTRDWVVPCSHGRALHTHSVRRRSRFDVILSLSRSALCAECACIRAWYRGLPAREGIDA